MKSKHIHLAKYFEFSIKDNNNMTDKSRVIKSKHTYYFPKKIFFFWYPNASYFKKKEKVHFLYFSIRNYV